MLYALYTHAIQGIYGIYTACYAPPQKIDLASGAKNLHPAKNLFNQEKPS